MLKLLLVATLCAVVLAAPRPYSQYGAGSKRRGPQNGGGRGQWESRDETVAQTGNMQGVPGVLPTMMSTQLDDLFRRMQLQQKFNQLDLTQWQNEVQVGVWLTGLLTPFLIG